MTSWISWRTSNKNCAQTSAITSTSSRLPPRTFKRSFLRQTFHSSRLGSQKTTKSWLLLRNVYPKWQLRNSRLRTLLAQKSKRSAWPTRNRWKFRFSNRRTSRRGKRSQRTRKRQKTWMTSISTRYLRRSNWKKTRKLISLMLGWRRNPRFLIAEIITTRLI